MGSLTSPTLKFVISFQNKTERSTALAIYGGSNNIKYLSIRLSQIKTVEKREREREREREWERALLKLPPTWIYVKTLEPAYQNID